VNTDFGGVVMSKEMSDWCSVQLKKLNGTEDLTLVHFCMTLNSAAEIKEYLVQYLGSSQPVRLLFFYFILFMIRNYLFNLFLYLICIYIYYYYYLK
jgi:hypothetical protein